MGLFSNPCPNSDCGARVKKQALFCSKCGWAGPNSLTSCPVCGKKVGGRSRFCWSCGGDLELHKAPHVMGDRWVRDTEELAVWIKPDDLKGFLARRVTVEPGTIGLIERQGRIVEEKEWGTHTLDQIIQLRRPSSIILISTGDIVLRPAFQHLRDAKGAELDLTIQCVLRVKDFTAFVRHYLEGHKRRVTYATLETRIGNELNDVVRALVSAHSLEDMYANLEWRNQLEANLRDVMTVTLDRHGVDLLQVNFVDFGGDHFEQLQRDRGEVYMGNHAADHLAEKLSIRRRVAELESQGKLAEVTNEKELADQIEQLNSQLGIRSVLRGFEREETTAQARQELVVRNQLRAYELEDLKGERDSQKEDEQVARLQMLERLTTGHQNEIAMTILIARTKRDATEADFLREQQRLQKQQTLTLEWDDSEQRRRNDRANSVQRYELLIEESKAKTVAGMESLKVKEKEQELAHSAKKADVEILAQIKRQEREDFEAIKRFELEEQRLKIDYERFRVEKQAEVQIATVRGNVDIATAHATTDAVIAQERARQLEERLGDHKSDKDALRQDADRRAADLKEMAGIVSRSQSTSQPSVVIAGPGGAQQAIGGTAGESPCPQCQRPVPHTANFCPWCRRDMRS